MEMPLGLVEVNQGLQEVFAGARDGGYRQLAHAVTERVKEGQESGQDRGPVRDVLAVQFGLDATLCALSKAPEPLPLEIDDRNYIAATCAERIAKVGVEKGLFIKLYEPHEELIDLMTPVEFQRLNSAEYLGVLIRAVFNDASPAIGGAHRVLKRRPDIENHESVIKRSTGLLVISGISRQRFKRTWIQLGHPYILPRHFVVDTEREPEVKFNDQARALIAAGSKDGVGCPAPRVANFSGSGTVLTRSWEQIVDYSLPQGATSNRANGKVNIRS